MALRRRGRWADPADLAVVDLRGGHQPGGAGDLLGRQVARMDVGHDGPPGVVQPAYQAARRFLGVTAPLRGMRYYPGHLGRPGGGTTGGQRRLHGPHGRAGAAQPQHPVAPQLVTSGRAAHRQVRVALGQSRRTHRRATGELVQPRVVQQGRQFGGVGHRQRLQVEPLGPPALVEVDHTPAACYAVPSTSTSLPVEARCRIAIAAAYSCDPYHRRACSALGNSSTTTRRGFQSPSSVSKSPPRTRNRPSYGRSVSGTSAAYSRYASGSWMSISAITYAVICSPLRAGRPAQAYAGELDGGEIATS